MELRKGPKEADAPATAQATASAITVVQATPSAPPRVLQRPEDPHYMVGTTDIFLKVQHYTPNNVPPPHRLLCHLA